MKSFLLFLLAIFVAQSSFAQWQYNGSNAYLLNGNVGIGTSTPQTNLEISNGNLPALYFTKSLTPLMGVGQIYNDGSFHIAADDVGNGRLIFSGGGAISFRSSNNGNDNIYIDGNGNMGVGTTTPLSRFQVFGSNATLWGITLGYGTNSATITTDDASKPIVFQIAGNESMRLVNNGNVGIGTTNPGNYKLAVNGGIHTQSVQVDMTGWNDYVFDSDYQLNPLSYLKLYIIQNHHLPEVPSEEEVKDKGVNVGEMISLQTKKIEELTLYLIQKDDQLKVQQLEIDELKKQRQIITQQQKEIDDLKQKLNTLPETPNKTK